MIKDIYTININILGLLMNKPTICSPSQFTIYMVSGRNDLSKNLQEFLEIILDSTINIRLNLRSTNSLPPPLFIGIR